MLYRNNLSNIRNTWAGVSTNGGASFSNNLLVDATNWMIMSCPSTGPDAVIIGDTVYNTFMSQSGGSARVYTSKFSLSGGVATPTSMIAGNITGLSQQNYPRMAKAGTAAGIVWRQVISGTPQVALAFTNTITSGFPSTPEVVATGIITNADIAMTQNTVHVVWEDDNSGTVMYRKGTYYPSSVEEVLTVNKYIALSPNPAKDFFSISIKDMSGVTECILIDNTGKKIQVGLSKTSDKIIVSLEGIADGIYFALLKDDKGNSYYSKVIKQNK